MPPKRPVENNEESEEKRLRLDESPGFSVEPVTHNTCQGCDSVTPVTTTAMAVQNSIQNPESLNMDSNLQTTAGPALTISPPLIETRVSRVADEVTCGLQPLPGPSSEEQPSSHKPAQGVADSQDKTKSLVEQMFCVNQSLAVSEETHCRTSVFKRNTPVQHDDEMRQPDEEVEIGFIDVEVETTEQDSSVKSSDGLDEDFLNGWNSEKTEQRPGQTSSDTGSSQCSALPRAQQIMQARHQSNLQYIRTAASGIPTQPLPSSSMLLQLGKSVERPRPYYDEVDFCEVDCNSKRGFPPSGIPVDVYQYLVADDWSSIKVEGPEHTVIEIEGFPDDPFDSGTFQVAFKAKRIAPCRFLTGTEFVFKQPKSDRYGVSEENAIMHLTAEESWRELERENETKTAKEVQVAAVCRSLCYHFSQECKTKIKDFGRDIRVIRLMHVKLKSGQFPPWGSMEPYIQGRWRKFINNDGQVVDIGEHPSEEVVEFSKKSLAFSHWTYTKFDRKALVCDLQGTDFQLTDLEIASSDGSLFGMGNLSDYALKMFKKKHSCNEYCAELELKALESFKPNDLEQSVASPEGGNHSPETT